MKDGLNIPFRVFNDDPLSLINSTNSKVMSSLLSYFYDHKILINETVELISQYRPIPQSKITSIRNIIKTIRNCNDLTIK